MTPTPEPTRILLIEDNPADVDLVRAYLAPREGDPPFEVSQVERLQDALRALRDAQFDLIMLDLNLPDSAGIATFETLYAAWPHTPIVVVSGSTEVGLGVQSVQGGAQDYIIKDNINATVLPRVIRYAIERHRLVQQYLEQNQKLDASHRRMYRILASHADGIVIADASGQTRYANPVAAEQFGAKDGELLGAPVPFPVTDGAGHEVNMRGANGREWTAEIRSVAIDWEGQPSRLFSIRDVTERRAMTDKLRHAQTQRALAQLAGGIAHDFNNLLMGLSGNVQLFAQRARDKTLLDDVDGLLSKLATMSELIRRCSTLVKQLLSFSQKTQPESRPLDTHRLIDETIPLLRQIVGDASTVQVRLEAANNAVMADSEQLKNILLDLTLNARDAMPGGGTLTIHTFNSNGNLILEVSDTGHGMSDDARTRLFQPFFTTKGVGQGSGLSLAAAYGVIQNYNGTIGVRTELDKGTTFVITLPSIKTETPLRPLDSGNRETILVIDDDPFIRTILVEFLRSLGYKPELAGGGEEAIRFYRQHKDHVRLVMLDLRLPGMDGAAIFRELRVIRPDTPFLIMSGYSDNSVDAMLNDGAVGFIHKPFQLADLETAILETLKKEIIS